MLKNRIAKVTESFQSDVQAVWNVVTDNAHYKWRSDLSNIEIIGDGSQWLEYYDDKNYTKFTIKEKKPYEKYVLHMENKLFSGVWTGLFSSTDNGGAKIVFTEEIAIKNPILRFISRFAWNLQKIQMVYIHDLKRELTEV